MTTIPPKTHATKFDRVVIPLIVVLVALIIGFNVGLATEAKRALVSPPAHVGAPIDSQPDRWAQTYRDTTQGGSVIEVYTDYVWHESILIITYRGEEIARAEILR